MLRPICKIAKSVISKGKLAISPFDAMFSAAEAAIEALGSRMKEFRGFLDGLPQTFEMYGQIIARLARCAYVDENLKLQDTLNGAMDGIIGAIELGHDAMVTLSDTTTHLVSFAEGVETAIVAPVRTIWDKMKGVARVLDHFSWLRTFFEFKITLWLPTFSPIRFGPQEVSLAQIADFVGKIIKILVQMAMFGGFFGWLIFRPLIALVERGVEA